MSARRHRKGARPTPVAKLASILAILSATACTGGASGSPQVNPVEPMVTEEIVERALASELPHRLNMTDEIEFLTRRLAESIDDERWIRQRLTGAHLMRFRAYGGQSDLEEARAHLAVLGGTGETSDPTPELLSLRSAVRLAQHDFAGALDDAEEANRRLGDFDSGYRLRLFDALWAAGAYARAEQLLLLPHDHDSFDYLVRQARLLDRQGRVEEARRNMERARSEAEAYAEPAGVVAWVITELGHFESHAGQPREAVRRYLESLAVLPGNPAALEGLGRVAMGVDRNDEAAVLLFSRAIRNGGHLDLYLDLAAAWDRLGEAHKAELARAHFLQRATESEEAERSYRRPLALLLADHYPDRLGEALEHALRDVAVRPTSESWDTLAWVRYRLGELDPALEDSRRATAWGQPEPLVAYHSATIAAAAGDETRASTLSRAAMDAASELSLEQLCEVRSFVRGRDYAGEPSGSSRL